MHRPTVIEWYIYSSVFRWLVECLVCICASKWIRWLQQDICVFWRSLGWHVVCCTVGFNSWRDCVWCEVKVFLSEQMTNYLFKCSDMYSVNYTCVNAVQFMWLTQLTDMRPKRLFLIVWVIDRWIDWFQLMKKKKQYTTIDSALLHCSNHWTTHRSSWHVYL